MRFVVVDDGWIGSILRRRDDAICAGDDGLRLALTSDVDANVVHRLG
jgi:hypothetical protein